MDQENSGSGGDQNQSQSAGGPPPETCQGGDGSGQPSLEAEAQNIDFAKANTSANGEVLVGAEFVEALVSNNRGIQRGGEG